MTVLHSVDFFPSGNASVAIEPRLPQADFPEHHHDFHEIVIVEHGTGIHVFNGQPYTITGGTVCFVRDHDRHLYEHTDNLCLTNVLLKGTASPLRAFWGAVFGALGMCGHKSWMGSIRLTGALTTAYCSRCDSWLHRWNSRKGKMIYPRPPVARSCLCNYCSCCVKAVCRRTWKTAHHVSTCFWPGWRTILPMR
mgnify:CR=1 FL=1